MTLEPISGVTSPVVARVDEVRVANRQDHNEAAVPDAVPTELPSRAVQETLSAQEEEQLKKATEMINEFVKDFSSDLRFSVDEDTGKTVVKVLEKQTGELIRQIPSKEMLQIARAIDTLQGLI